MKCIRKDFEKVSEHIKEVHRKTREDFDLPAEPYKNASGIACKLCSNECKIKEGKKGYCGLRKNEDGKLIGPTKNFSSLSLYHDNLPTNCVADWICPGGTGKGFPEFSYKDGPEYGYKNLAIFFIGCSFNCLFCQNWHYRNQLNKPSSITVNKLLKAIDNRTSCVCYFGGDPAPQLPFSIELSKRAIEAGKNRILRFCWETNGAMHPKLLEKLMELALNSGGCVKFDLKTFDERLNLALCGVTNKRTLENFALASTYVRKRKEIPILVASTLLVPGYIDSKEIFDIAKFIAGLDRSIPYSLLGFAPNFYMSDLPCTSKKHAQNCKSEAERAGLTNIKVGNIHLLGEDYTWY